MFDQKKYIALLLVFICQACELSAITSNRALEIGNSYLTQNLPQVPLSDLRVEVIDLGDRWRLSYNPPSGSTGGPIIIVIDKDMGRVIHTEAQQ